MIEVSSNAMPHTPEHSPPPLAVTPLIVLVRLVGSIQFSVGSGRNGSVESFSSGTMSWFASSVSIGLEGAPVEDVAGQEVAHVAGDLVGRLLGPVLRQRGVDLVGHAADAVAAQLVGLHQLGLRVAELIRVVEALDALEQVLGGALVGVDLSARG